MKQNHHNPIAQHAIIMMMAAAVVMGFSACKTASSLDLPQTTLANDKKPVQMILDSDFGSSTDDLFALMMLNHYLDDGLVDLKGIVVDREGEKNAALVDIFNTYYCHPEVPIGLERNGVKNPRCFIPYNGICDLKDAQGTPLFKRSVDTSRCPEGYKLYRQLLSQADDKSIVVVAIGFATTLAQLFESGADEYSPLSGVELFGKKVKSVYIQSGRFEAGDSLSGYNMRAASRQSAIFYDRLPKNVDLIMSPSNVGDQIDYLPKDVLVDLSYTEINPIKAVYTHYTCDTGQRMWDTNCLVQAVLGDAEYNLSPRGWVTFVDRGEESLMLFKADPQGNARYQLPGDTYLAQQKLMDIRRHNRMNRYPSSYTIEAPQPQLITDGAVEWVRPRMQLLKDKYMGSAGNKLDPDNVRMLFRPIGYVGPNAADYREAENILVGEIYRSMLQKALNLGKKDVVIVTGPPASGKTTAVNQMKLDKVGLIFDATLTEGDRLEQAVAQAKAAGMEKVTLVMVYNDVVTCFKNDVQRGKNIWRYAALDYLVEAFRNNKGLLEQIHDTYPDVEIVPVSFAGNQPMQRVSIEEALKWNYTISDSQLKEMLSYLLDELKKGAIEPIHAPIAAGNVTAIPGLNSENLAIAQEIEQVVKSLIKENRIR
ncbi:MAG: hypothetical protein IIZ97_05715 [Prevotella sp.]|nr:hypothetical protein [Prevotella sp.]